VHQDPLLSPQKNKHFLLSPSGTNHKGIVNATRIPISLTTHIEPYADAAAPSMTTNSTKFSPLQSSATFPQNGNDASVATLSRYLRFDLNLRAGASLKSCHDAFIEHAKELQIPSESTDVLNTQHDNFEAMLAELVKTTLSHIKMKQREINREFAPVIREAMETVYNTIMNEKGDGCLKRMRRHMQEHVNHEKERYMFPFERHQLQH
jgi:hypothetical protein